MAEMIISLKGLRDSRRDAKKPVTRLLRFPDGITRHVTLPAWKWAVFDRFDRREVVLSPQDLIRLAFDTARENKHYPGEPFEDVLRRHLSSYLGLGVPYSSDYIRDLANDG